MKNTPLSSFLILLTLVTALAFAAHVTIRIQSSLEWNAYLLVPAYLFNYTLAGLSGILLYRFRTRFSASLGFIFFGISLLKFLLFFLLFYPTYHADDEISKAEFGTFFIPYALCLIIETRFLIKELNKL